MSRLNTAVESSVIGLFNQQWKTIKYKQTNITHQPLPLQAAAKLEDRAKSHQALDSNPGDSAAPKELFNLKRHWKIMEC